MNFRQTTINMLSGAAGYVFPMLINLLSAPYILDTLGEEAYGLQVLANVVIGYLIVAEMGLDIPITHQIAKHHVKNETKSQSRFIVATLKIYCLIGIAGMIALFLGTDNLVSILEVPQHLTGKAHYIFILCGIGFWGSVINMWGKAIFNGFQRYDIANGVSIFNNLFGVIFGVIAVWYGLGVVGFFAARVLGFIISCVVYIVLIKIYILKFSIWPIVDKIIWDQLKKKIGYGFVLRISGMVFSKLDQVLIGAWIGVSAVTVFSFPILLATAISGLISSITHFSFPMVSAMLSNDSSDSINIFFIRITKFIACISIMLFTPFIVYGDKILSLWLNPLIAEEGGKVMLLLMVSYLINSCTNIGINSFIMGMGLLKYFTYYSAIRGLLLSIGFLTLIKPFGLNGAGISYVFALFVDLFFVVYTLDKKLKLRFSTLFSQAYLKPLIVGLPLGLSMIFARSFINTWSELLLYIFLFESMFIILAYIMGIIDDSELVILKFIFKKYKASS